MMKKAEIEDGLPQKWSILVILVAIEFYRSKRHVVKLEKEYIIKIHVFGDKRMEN